MDGFENGDADGAILPELISADPLLLRDSPHSWRLKMRHLHRHGDQDYCLNMSWMDCAHHCYHIQSMTMIDVTSMAQVQSHEDDQGPCQRTHTQRNQRYTLARPA